MASPTTNSLAHVLADTATGEAGVLVTMCGREYPAHRTPTFSVAPGLSVCPACEPFAGIDRPAPVFPAPPGGQPRLGPDGSTVGAVAAVVIGVAVGTTVVLSTRRRPPVRTPSS